jgi:hypothetical protein
MALIYCLVGIYVSEFEWSTFWWFERSNFPCLVEVRKDLGSKKLVSSSDVTTVFLFYFILILYTCHEIVARKVL